MTERNSFDFECDVLIAGSGAGGLSAAITSKILGLDAVVYEKADKLGGTTARSGGWIWIPLSLQARRAGIQDSEEEVLTYIHSEAGGSFDQEVARSFVKAGHRMLDVFEQKTCVRFSLSKTFPDYHPDARGAKSGGRSLDPLPFDARELGGYLDKLARPLRELSLAGMVIGSGTELKHFFNATRSLSSALFVAKKILAHSLDVLRYGRGMTLVNGNALAARLMKSAIDLKIPLNLQCQVMELIEENDRVVGAVINREGQHVRVRARRGVVLAAGGFPHDVARRQSLYKHAAGVGEHLSMAPAPNTGDGIVMAKALGAATADGYSDHAAWAPVSSLTWPDGSSGQYPHFVDRGKPGIIAVNEHGERFVNESNSYHDFIKGFVASNSRRIFFIADSVALSRYGLGIAKPFPFPKRHWIRSGYLYKAKSVAELAKRIGVDVQAFEKTIREFNLDARDGKDHRFARGSTAYNHFQGDTNHAPNPCLAPLDTAPYFAVEVHPGDIGTFAGLVTNSNAQVLRDGAPIGGLYAAGNDMASVMGGAYPGAGITLGPALTFGFVAAHHIAGVPLTG